MSANKDEIIKLNVGGKRHSVYKSTLLTYPDTLLARMVSSSFEIASKDAEGAYFFDRNPEVFDIIINFYRTKQILVPKKIPLEVVKLELEFFNITIDEDDIEIIDRPKTNPIEQHLILSAAIKNLSNAGNMLGQVIIGGPGHQEFVDVFEENEYFWRMVEQLSRSVLLRNTYLSVPIVNSNYVLPQENHYNNEEQGNIHNDESYYTSVKKLEALLDITEKRYRQSLPNQPQEPETETKKETEKEKEREQETTEKGKQNDGQEQGKAKRQKIDLANSVPPTELTTQLTETLELLPKTVTHIGLFLSEKCTCTWGVLKYENLQGFDRILIDALDNTKWSYTLLPVIYHCYSQYDMKEYGDDLNKEDKFQGVVYAFTKKDFTYLTTTNADKPLHHFKKVPFVVRKEIGIPLFFQKDEGDEYDLSVYPPFLENIYFQGAIILSRTNL